MEIKDLKNIHVLLDEDRYKKMKALKKSYGANNVHELFAIILDEAFIPHEEIKRDE